MAMQKMALMELVEDFGFYPRNRVDEAHVNDLVHSLAAGATLPPIVVDKQKRMVDGFHRRRAWLRHLGPDGAVRVDVRSYKSDAEMFLDAVSLNASHGRKLDRHDQSRIVLKLREYGVEDSAIAVSLHVPEQAIQTLSVRVVYGPSGDIIPAKRGLKHMHGRQFTETQVKVMQSVRSAEAGRLCLELARLLNAGMVDLSDDQTVERLKQLQNAIKVALRAKAA